MAARISRRAQQALEEDVQYLNLAEMRSFCQAHGLPLYIHLERADGRLRRTGDRDRKDIVLRRILDFALHGRNTGPTIYRSGMVATGPLPALLTSRTRVRYGQYEKKNERFLAALRRLTGGTFETGMIARLVLRDFWIAGTAPTIKQFADEWSRAKEAHTQPRPEGAYLVDLWRGEAGSGWKQLRVQRARRALEQLSALIR